MYVVCRQMPSNLVDNSDRLYRDFKKLIPRDLDSYYLLSFKVCIGMSCVQWHNVACLCSLQHWVVTSFSFS